MIRFADRTGGPSLLAQPLLRVYVTGYTQLRIGNWAAHQQGHSTAELGESKEATMTNYKLYFFLAVLALFIIVPMWKSQIQGRITTLCGIRVLRVVQ